MDDIMWLPIGLLALMIPLFFVALFTELIMMRETEERNKLNGWEN